MRGYERGRVQGTAVTEAKKRCTRTGRHSNGSGVLCDRHHQLWMVKRANDAQIVRKAK